MDELKLKTLSELKLRNPSIEVCEGVSKIIAKYGENSASKALEKYIIDFSNNQERLAIMDKKIKEMSLEIQNLRHEKNSIQSQLNKIKETYKAFLNLITGDKTEA